MDTDIKKINNDNSNDEQEQNIAIEKTDNGISEEHDQDITSPFSVKNIKITNAPILLASLINRLKRDEIDLNPDFQRHANLWTINQMSRLIESILLKLPLPIFYFDVSDSDKWIVVDGLQRISTIKKFFIDNSFKLKNMEFLDELNGKNYDELDRRYARTVDETLLLTYQIEAQTPKEVRYSIFNRINTGGLPLKAQEIRQALNQKGGGVKFLKQIVEEELIFKKVVGISNKRMAGQELVLRFVAFKILNDDKFKIMSSFLDLAMEEVDSANPQDLDKLKESLINTLEFSEKILGKGHKFSRFIADENKNKVVNLSLFDVLTVCFDEIEDQELFLNNKDFFVTKFKELLKDENGNFFVSITKGTSGKWAKETRFSIIRKLIKQTLTPKELRDKEAI
jgi:hypothetical protein